MITPWHHLLPAIREAGFKRTYVCSGMVEYTCYMEDRYLTMQLWRSGKHRVSHRRHKPGHPTFARGSTFPSTFGYIIADMLRAIKCEAERMDGELPFGPGEEVIEDSLT